MKKSKLFKALIKKSKYLFKHRIYFIKLMHMAAIDLKLNKLRKPLKAYILV